MADIKFSIVIPAFNAQNTIIRTIESCLRQTLSPWEIIVVNDGSKDNTLSVLSNYQNNPIIRIFSFQENLGVSTARNYGWNKSKGDYIAFLDSDDIWHCKKLEIANQIIRNKKGMLCIGNQYTDNEHVFHEQGILQVDTLHYWNFLKKNYFNTSCLMVSKYINERFDENMRYTEDHELYLRISESTNIHFIRLPLTLLGRPQLSKGGLSGSRLKMRIGEIKMYYKACKRRKKIILFPFFCLYSIMKYLIKLF